MSLVDFKYEVDADTIVLIRLDDAAALVAAYGAQPAGNLSHDFHVAVSRSRTAFGIHPRGVRWRARVQVAAGPPPKLVSTTLILPMLSIAAWEALVTGPAATATLTYAGVTYRPASKIAQALV